MDSFLHEFSSIRRPETMDEVRNVPLRGLLADLEERRDLLVRGATRHEREHRELTRGETTCAQFARHWCGRAGRHLQRARSLLWGHALVVVGGWVSVNPRFGNAEPTGA
jgi:hypothetical protein